MKKIILTMLLALSCATMANQVDIYAYGNSKSYFDGHVSYHFLARTDRIYLPKGSALPSDARNLALPQSLVAKIKHTYQMKAVLVSIGIKKLPAIVFDSHYVVYGTTDIQAARTAVIQYRRYHHD